MAQACLGRYLQAILPHDLSGTWRGGSGSAGRHLAPAWELGGGVRVRCQYGSARAVCEQMFCGVFAPAQLRREDMSISGWRLSGEQQTLTLRLLHVNPCLLKPCETTKHTALFGFQIDRKLYKHNTMLNF